MSTGRRPRFPLAASSTRRGVTGVVAVLALAVGCAADGGETPSSGRGPGQTPDLPVPRTEVAGATLGSTIVVAGGLTADAEASDLVHLYDSGTDGWRRGPSLPLGLHHVGLAALGDRIWLVGGYSTGPGGAWVPQAATYSLAVGESAWRSEPPLNEARGGLALAAVAGTLVAIGGTTPTGIATSVELLVPGERSWKAGPSLSEPRDHLAAASSAGRVYAIAGRVGPLESNLSSVESWAPGEPWRPEPALNHGRGGTSAAEVGATVCVAGGEEPRGTIASVECLGTGGWRVAASLDVPRHGLAVAGLGPELHVVGGGPTPGLSVSGEHEVIRVG